MPTLNLDWPHVVLGGIVAVVTGLLLWFHLVPVAAGVGILAAIAGISVPTNWTNWSLNKQLPPSPPPPT